MTDCPLSEDERMPINIGHGHVFPRPDGVKARCGGPAMCSECARDLAHKQRAGKVIDVDLRALIQAYEHQAKGGVALAPFPREVLVCLTELAGYRRMKDGTGHVIGHPSNCRVNNGLDGSCNCGIEP